MISTVYFAGGLVVHVFLAGFLLKRKTSAIGWRMPYYRATLAQFAASMLACLGLAAILVLAAFSGVLEDLAAEFPISVPAFAIFMLLWWLGQTRVVHAMASRTRSVVVPAFRVTKICRSLFFTLLHSYAVAGLIALAIAGLSGRKLPDALADLGLHEAMLKPRERGGAPDQATPRGIGESAGARGAGTASRRDRSVEVLAAMDAWARAWSKQDLNTYFAAYATGFTPPRNLSRRQWEASRRNRIIQAREISVRSAASQAAFTGPDRAAVMFRQNCHSSRYNVVVKGGRTR